MDIVIINFVCIKKKISSGITKMHVLLGEILGWVTSRDFS